MSEHGDSTWSDEPREAKQARKPPAGAQQVEVHVHFHFPDAVLTAFPQLVAGLAAVRAELSTLTEKVTTMAGELQTLTTEVSEATGVMASAVTLVEGLAQRLRDAIAANDPAKLTALADELDRNSNALAAAVAANPDPGAGGGTSPTPSGRGRGG